MNLIDIFIVLFFLSALVRGTELGSIRQVCSTVGLFGGLFLGVFIQSKIIHMADSTNTKALLALVVIIACIAGVSVLGEYLGARLKHRLEHARLRGVNVFDKAFGSVVAGVSLLLAVWLGAAIFTNVPVESIQKQVKGSVIIAQLNKSLPSAPGLVTRIGHLIDPNSFPNVFTGLEPTIDTNRPLPSIGELDAGVKIARASTVKIEGEGCGGISQGSGFVADTNLVITNAHVVAGVARPYIIDGAGRHQADVVFFDANLDMAILRSSKLAGQPLAIREGLAENGTASAILGYPGGGDFTAHPAVVIDSFKAIGRNIYNQGETSREVYSLKGTIRPGNSGGPLVNKEGMVIGMIFAESTAYENVGYALTTDQIITNLSQAKADSRPVSTGSCTQ